MPSRRASQRRGSPSGSKPEKNAWTVVAVASPSSGSESEIGSLPASRQDSR
jgi:hypothetical protein